MPSPWRHGGAIPKELDMKIIETRNGIWNVKLAASGLIVAALIFMTASFGRGQGAPNGDAVLQAPKHDAGKELSMKITDPFTFAAAGDIIIRRPVAQLEDPGFQALTKVMRSADMTYANMEGPIIDE